MLSSSAKIGFMTVRLYMAGNSSSLSINNFLTKNISQLSQSFKKLASGSRINSASDDAAGLAIAEALGANAATLQVANRNTQDAQSAIEIADGAISQVGDIGSRLKELATQASNGTLSDTQRAALQTEFSELSQEIGRITNTTEFNGIKLVTGDEVTAQVGSDSSADSQIKVPGTSIATASSDVASQNISTQAGAQAALAKVDTLIQQASQSRGQLGASSSRLSVAESANSSRYQNVRAAESRIRDVDVAEESAKLTSAQIRTNAATAISAQAGKLNANNVLKLLK